MVAILSPHLEALQLDDRISLSPKKMAKLLDMSIGDLADAALVHRNTMRMHPESTELQNFLREIFRVFVSAEGITRDRSKAALWLRYQPIEEFEGRTAFEVLASDREHRGERARDLLNYLASIESGFVG